MSKPRETLPSGSNGEGIKIKAVHECPECGLMWNDVYADGSSCPECNNTDVFEAYPAETINRQTTASVLPDVGGLKELIESIETFVLSQVCDGCDAEHGLPYCETCLAIEQVSELKRRVVTLTTEDLRAEDAERLAYWKSRFFEAKARITALEKENESLQTGSPPPIHIPKAPSGVSSKPSEELWKFCENITDGMSRAVLYLTEQVSRRDAYIEELESLLNKSSGEV